MENKLEKILEKNFITDSSNLEEDYFGDLESNEKTKKNNKSNKVQENIEFTAKDEITEGLLDVIFNKLIYNLKVSLQGNILEFKIFFPGSKTLFKLRLKKDTALKYKKWIDKIFEDIKE